MGLLPVPNWIDLDGDRMDCEAIEWAWRLDKKDRDAQKEAQGGAGMKTVAQSCKITIGNAESGHTVHFPDGCNEHVEARPFEDIDGVIERAIKQRETREARKPENPATPPYYRFRIKGIDCDVFDIAKSAGLTPAATMALKYLLRAGKKDGAVDDLRKCIRCVEREIELGEGKANA